MATFLMAQMAANLSWVSRETAMATFLISSTAATSHGFPPVAMATFPMVQKGGQFSKMACFLWRNGANSHWGQSDIMLTDVAKAD
jgi:hypothetical protein